MKNLVEVKEINFFEEEHALLMGYILTAHQEKLTWNLPKDGLSNFDIDELSIYKMIDGNVIELPIEQTEFLKDIVYQHLVRNHFYINEWIHHRIECMYII